MPYFSSRRTVVQVVCLVAALLVAAVVAGCGGSDESSTATSKTAAPASPRTSHATVDAREGPLGTYLVDGAGKTLYYFAADTSSKSNCYGVCAAGWPVLAANGTPTGGAGVNTAKLGTTTRADGTKQVTFDHRPLYYFVLDAKAGDIFGQDLPSFGGPWWMIDPTSGEPITTAPPALPPASPPAAPDAVTVKTHKSSLGTYLTGASGKTVYHFDGDHADTPKCAGLCAEVWPPVLIDGTPTAGHGITSSMLGTAKRADGTTQVTYNHKPLYYFALDGDKAGVTKGQGQKIAGDTWWVVSPGGSAIHERIPANGPAASPAAAHGTPSSAGTTLKLSADNSGKPAYDTNALSAKAGKVTIAFTNDSPISHDVVVQKGTDGRTLGGTPTFDHATKSLTVTLAPGKYTYYCSVPGHRQAGMVGTLTVSR